MPVSFSERLVANLNLVIVIMWWCLQGWFRLCLVNLNTYIPFDDNFFGLRVNKVDLLLYCHEFLVSNLVWILQDVFEYLSWCSPLCWSFTQGTITKADSRCLIAKVKLKWIVLAFLLILTFLSSNPTKRSNRLKQFVGCCRRIVWARLTILWGWRLKG